MFQTQFVDVFFSYLLQVMIILFGALSYKKLRLIRVVSSSIRSETYNSYYSLGKASEVACGRYCSFYHIQRLRPLRLVGLPTAYVDVHETVSVGPSNVFKCMIFSCHWTQQPFCIFVYSNT